MKSLRFFLFLLLCVGSWGRAAFSAGATPTPDAIPLISGEQFQKVDQSLAPVVLDFWAKWCAPCQVYSQVVSHVAKTFQNQITFYRIDVSDFSNDKRVQSYSIESLPTLIVVVRGKVVERWEGVLKDKDLKSKLNQVVKTWVNPTVSQP